MTNLILCTLYITVSLLKNKMRKIPKRMWSLISKCWLSTSRWHENYCKCRSVHLLCVREEKLSQPMRLVFYPWRWVPEQEMAYSSRQRVGDSTVPLVSWPLPCCWHKHVWPCVEWFWGTGLLHIVTGFNLLYFPIEELPFLGSARSCLLKVLQDLSLVSDLVIDYFLSSLRQIS